MTEEEVQEEITRTGFQMQMDTYLKHVARKATWDEIKSHLQKYISSDARSAESKLQCKNGSMTLVVEEDHVLHVLEVIETKIRYHVEQMENP